MTGYLFSSTSNSSRAISIVVEDAPLWLFILAVPFDVFEELDGVSFTHTLFFFKSINLPISHLFSIFGAVFSTKHGAKIVISHETTK